MFPVSFDGAVEVGELGAAEAAAILDRLEQDLVARRASSVTRLGDTLLFRRRLSPVYGHAGWIAGIRVPPGRGDVTVLPGDVGRVVYSFSTLLAPSICTAVWIAAIALLIADGDASCMIPLFGIGWIFSLWLNWTWSRNDIRDLVRRATGIDGASVA